MTEADLNTNTNDRRIRPEGGAQAVLARRGLIRAGAIAAAATAGAVAATAGSTQSASAATGDAVKVGGAFTADKAATSLTVTNSTTLPALRLTNATGPSLVLTPISDGQDPMLPLGGLAGTKTGPLIGLSDGTGAVFTSTLVTGVDLAAMPTPLAITPTRLLDTRYASGRGGILGSSAAAFDSSHRLIGGKYLDLFVGDADQDVTLQAAFLNITVTGALANGYIAAYPPGPRPTASTLNYVKNVTLANGAFVALGLSGTAFAVRIYASSTSHVIVDLTGAAVTGEPGPAAAAAAATTARTATRIARTRPASRFTRTMGAARRR